MGGHRSRLRRAISQWASHERYEADDLRKDTERAGFALIADAPDRERVKVQGMLRTVTLRPRGGVPALEAELYDGSDVLLLVWLGRRRISGVNVGRVLRVEGRITPVEGGRVLYNPRYQLIEEDPTGERR